MSSKNRGGARKSPPVALQSRVAKLSRSQSVRITSGYATAIHDLPCERIRSISWHRTRLASFAAFPNAIHSRGTTVQLLLPYCVKRILLPTHPLHCSRRVTTWRSARHPTRASRLARLRHRSHVLQIRRPSCDTIPIFEATNTLREVGPQEPRGVVRRRREHSQRSAPFPTDHSALTLAHHVFACSMSGLS